MRGPGFGDHEGVEVYESEKEIPNLAEVMKSWREWQKESLGGVDAYSAPPELEGPLETWIAAPTKRILLVATRRAILEESLLRKGANLVSVLASMGCERAIDWKSPVVIVRRYDAENEADIYSPLNTKAKGIAPMTRGFNVDGLLLEYRAGEAPGLRAWVRTEEPESSRRYFEELLWPKPDAGSSPDLLSASPSAPGEILLEGTFPASVPPGLPLVLFMAFGLNFVL
ncbi:MAG TPA: hypothetical protein VFI25_10825 [Planctomycetota bacterium]|nr:hypothetical protein [Planctomycetota bacterium]